MNRIKLGKSGLEVSPVCYGCWQLSERFWGPQPKDVLIQAMRRAYEVGVNFYDTADAYGDGYSEQVVGEALKELPRDRIVVATKVFHHFYPDGHRHPDLSGPYILQECDASLKRMRLDYIDLYQCHSFEPLADLAEIVEAMSKLRKAGKIRAYGVSNFTVEQLRAARSVGDFSTLQPRYNLFQREIEADLLPFCRANGVGVLVYSPLFHGLLTGKYTGAETFTDLRANNPNFQGDRFKDLAGRVRKLAPIAADNKMTIIQLVLAVTLMNSMIDCAIVGIKTPQQIEEAAGVMGRTVSREDFFKVRNTLGSL